MLLPHTYDYITKLFQGCLALVAIAVISGTEGAWASKPDDEFISARIVMMRKSSRDRIPAAGGRGRENGREGNGLCFVEVSQPVVAELYRRGISGGHVLSAFEDGDSDGNQLVSLVRSPQNRLENCGTQAIDQAITQLIRLNFGEAVYPSGVGSSSSPRKNERCAGVHVVMVGLVTAHVQPYYESTEMTYAERNVCRPDSMDWDMYGVVIGRH